MRLRSAGPEQELQEQVDSNLKIEELSSTSAEDLDSEDYSDDSQEEPQPHPSDLVPNVPDYFTNLLFPRDVLQTETSEAQEKTAQLCMKLLRGEGHEIKDRNSHGIPSLLRDKHIKFLKGVIGKLPPPFQVMDAGRPWLFYWALAGMAHLGHDVSHYRKRLQQTVAPLQNLTGGFGGGHGQISHCAPSYAIILSLALVDGLDVVDRKAMWHWLGSIKQRDGGFRLAVGGEQDVRGAYCAMTIINLLNLPLELPPDSPANTDGKGTFLDNLGEWLGRCQTYEGGIGDAPDHEAHGAFAFCCLACLSIMDAPHRSIPRYLNTGKLLSWLTARQATPEGGFSGRTNKLVDACYSHWVGGCWSLLQAALPDLGGASHESKVGNGTTQQDVWNREGLVRYSLCCSQVKGGGLRDKPGTRADGYHTCYSLAGLSAAQNHWSYKDDVGTNGFNGSGTSSSGGHALSSAFNWVPSLASEEERKRWAFDLEDTVGFVHPVFVITPEAVERARRQFEHVVGF